MRNLYLTQHVDDASVKALVEKIVEFNSEDDKEEKEKRDYKRETINLYIQTNGGEIRAGAFLINVIQQSKTKVRGICLGKAYSCGLPIFVACHERVSAPSALFMYHNAWTIASGSAAQLQGATNYLKYDHDYMDEIIISRTKITKEKLKKISRKNDDAWFFNGDEALKLGVVDKFIKQGRTY